MGEGRGEGSFLTFPGQQFTILTMKKTLIVTAHPSSHGFVHSIAESYAQGVKENKGTAEILDLYAEENQQPFLKFEELKEWPMDNVEKMQQKITDADEIVFCFPVWWGDAPAILKNWLDHNFTTGFAYKYTANGAIKLLAGKTARVFATSDAPGFAYGFFLSPMRLSWTQFRLGFCGLKVNSFQVFGKMRKRDEANRKQLLDTVKKLAQK